ncbi:MAG TPA: IgGFc-binding protein [Polyangia bacterium]|nr:IgGFc-binding protein [Polyangia bacterium]
MSSAAIWIVAAAVALGCSGSPASRRPDAGTVPSNCSVPLVCGGDGAVHSCNGKTIGAVIDNCASRGQACSLGRCTTSPCQVAEARTRSIIGCLFYTLQPDNVAADEAALTSYVINNAGTDPANVQLERATPGTSESTVWVPVLGANVQVAAGSAGRLQVAGLEVTNPGINPLGAVRVSSDRPISVAEIESDDGSQAATSSSGTVVLPLQSLGSSYRAVTYPQEATHDVQQAVGSRGGAARVIVVGTQPGTQISFKPVGKISGDPGPGQLVPPLAAGESLDVTLNDGDVFQIYTNAPDEDLTGSLVTVLSGAPVAVFSGNISTSYGSNVGGINSADMAHEQMPPLSSWSKVYVAAPLAPQSSIGCTSFFADGEGVGAGSIWRVVAGEDDTRVDFGPSSPERVWLRAGQSVTRVSGAPFTVTATRPVLVTQGIDCEPSLSLAISAEQNALLTDVSFAALPVFDQLVAIVRQSGTVLAMDGVPVSDSMFRAIDSQFELAELPVAACRAASGACLHRVTSTGGGFGLTLRGMDVSASYALTTPGLLRCDLNSELCLN